MHTTYLLPPFFLHDSAEPEPEVAEDVAETPESQPDQDRDDPGVTFDSAVSAGSSPLEPGSLDPSDLSGLAVASPAGPGLAMPEEVPAPDIGAPALRAAVDPHGGETDAPPMVVVLSQPVMDADELAPSLSAQSPVGEIGSPPSQVAADASIVEIVEIEPLLPPGAAQSVTEFAPIDILLPESFLATSLVAPDVPAATATFAPAEAVAEDAAPVPGLDAPPAASAERAVQPRVTGPWPEQVPPPDPGTEIDGCRIVRIGEGVGWLEIALAIDASLVCAVPALIWLDPALGAEVIAARAADAGRSLSLRGPGSLCLGACPGGALVVLRLQAGDALDLARGARLSARGAGLVAERRAPRGGTPVTRFRAVRPAMAILEVSGIPYALTLLPAATLIVGDGILVATDAGVLVTPVRQPLPAQRVFGPGSLLLRGGQSGWV